MAEPLPVDVVTSWTDIASLIVNTGAAVGTVGALLIAAFAYRRQVEDNHRRQASKVSIKVTDQVDGRSQLEIRNDSDQPIKVVRWDALALGEPEQEDVTSGMRTGMVHDLGGFEKAIVPPDGIPGDSVVAALTFKDESGETWVRTSKGAFHKMNRQFVDVYDLYVGPQPSSEVLRQRQQLRRIIARDLRWQRQ